MIEKIIEYSAKNKFIEADKVQIEGMDKPIDTKDLDYKLIKSLIWW